MHITLDLPDDLDRRPDPAREVLEALAIQGHRTGLLSGHRTRNLLAFQTREQLDGFLKEREVWEHSYSVEDLEKDAAGFERQS